MANGKMLDELRKLAESEKTLPLEAALRLILASQADSQESINKAQTTIHELGDSFEAIKKDVAELKQSRENKDATYDVDHTATQKTLEELRNQVAINTKALKAINDKLCELNTTIANNWFLKAGIFIQNHPKTFIGILIGLSILANLWFISGFRQGVMQWLGVPAPIIDLLNPTAVPAIIGTPTPSHIHFWELTPGPFTPFPP